MHLGIHRPASVNDREHPAAPSGRRGDGRTVAGGSRLLVASGKGGVGTSLMAALHALCAAERGDRVLLVDATETGGTLHHLLGARPSHSLWMLTDPRSRIDDVLIPVDEQLTLVAGGTSAAAVPPATDTERRAALRRLARTFASFDLIVIDAGSRLDTIGAVIEGADPMMLLVTSADRLSLAANYALLKAVAALRADAPIAVLANRHGDMLAQEACGFLTGAASHFLGRSIDSVGAVPDDPYLQGAIGAGMTLRDSIDGSPAADAVRGVVSRLIPSRRTPVPAYASIAMSPVPVSSSSTRRWA
ncbi:MAG TPA: P-loop NTPase [Gemmatimonadaceae bacterium]|jgi:MinD-like ATPase involved in chromosome partitioning or flagellar assembly|nr:P-loop NTPase [Gemmatimonadaceae bacterium]